MELQLFGKLLNPAGEPLLLAGCRVAATFQRRVAASETRGSLSGAREAIADSLAPTMLIESDSDLPVDPAGDTIAASQETISALVETFSDATGRFTLTFPDPTTITSESVRIAVFSPSGTKSEREHVVAAANLGPELLIGPVEFQATTLHKPRELATEATRRIRGRVIERAGKQLPASLQVLLLAREEGAAEGEPPKPILVARADASGYFSGLIVNAKFERVVAVVAGVPGEIPVTLLDALVPPRVPIVVELPDRPTGSASKDCDCSGSVLPRTPTQEDIADAPGAFSTDLGTGKCIRFNVPNRAIEEFNFYSVVRTTEPQIVEMTIESPRDRTEPPRPLPPPPPATPPAPAVAAGTIEAAIREALLLIPRGPSSLQPPPRPVTWQALEFVLRAAVNRVGGTQLSDSFFTQFPGWGQGAVWGFGGILDSLNDGNARLATVIRQAAAAGAIEVNRSTSGVIAPQAGVADYAAPDSGAIRHFTVARAASIHDRLGTRRPPGRVPMDARAPVDWDYTPTFHQAVSIAHGHLLHFKQVWYADGYSLGDLLYSLPLAPGQKKVISVVDWERRERATREEFTAADEGVQAAVSRDRDLNEVVSGALSESSRGGSRSTTQGVGAGKGSAGSGSYQGFNFGGVMAVSGGFGASDANAFNLSSRDLSSTALQTLRDRTLQSASAVRNLRSTIVQTASQGETVRATTEVVANHNHCHALTIQYFEVLRHFKVTHELAGVQECLFVPFPMGGFDRPKVVRWRESLSTYLKRGDLAPAFDAARRIETNWSEEYAPAARYADELVSAIFGELTLTILIPLPPFPEKPKPKPGETIEETEAAVRKALLPTEGPLGAILAVATLGASLVVGAATQAASDAAKAAAQGARALAESMLDEPSAEARYARFQQEVMPAVAAGFVDQLELYALTGASEAQAAYVKLNGADFTLVSEYRPGMPLLVSVRGRINTPIARANISALVIKSSVALPPGCRAIVNSASLRYQTKHFRHEIVNDERVNDDIDLPIVASTGAPSFLPPPPGFPTLPMALPPGFPADWIPVPGVTPIRGGNGAMLYTPLDEWEQRSPRLEDIRLSAELIEHLDANLEYYHHAIWWTMDPNRRYMLLDGYEAPNAGGRSVASVVDNSLIGIVGNSLVLPVAPGNRLDPEFKLASGVTLLEQYDPQSAAPPSRVSLPTRGVFAEAVMGDCNACEEIDDTRFWRWEDSPIDEPPALDMSALASRRGEPNFGTPTPFPPPIVNIQNSPQAPDFSGTANVLDTLTKQSFTDLSGLAGTQANAAAAYAKALETAATFGKEASTLAQQAAMTKNIGQVMRAIDQAEREGKIDSDGSKKHADAALGQVTGAKHNDAEDRENRESEAAVKAIDNMEGEIESVKTKTIEVKGKPRSAAAASVPVSISIRGFVPSDVWLLKVPTATIEEKLAPLLEKYGDVLPDVVVDLLRTAMGNLYLRGDNRDFQLALPRSSQYQADASFVLNPRTMTATKLEVTRRFADLAQVFRSSDTVQVQGEQQWSYKRRDDMVAPLMSGVPSPDEAADIKVEAKKVQPGEFVVRFTVNTQSYFPFLEILDQIKAVIPNTETGIGNFSKYADAVVAFVKSACPAMSANVTVHVFRTDSGFECSVTGVHDQFPSLEVWVNGRGMVKRVAQNGSVFTMLSIGDKLNPLESQHEPLQVRSVTR